METENYKIEIEQLLQIAKHQPVFDGDLISKQATRSLVAQGLVMYCQDVDLKIKGYAKGIGGYVLTTKGKNAVAIQNMMP